MARRRRTPGRDSRGRFTKGHGWLSKHLSSHRYSRDPLAINRKRLKEFAERRKKQQEGGPASVYTGPAGVYSGHGLREVFKKVYARHQARKKLKTMKLADIPLVMA